MRRMFATLPLFDLVFHKYIYVVCCSFEGWNHVYDASPFRPRLCLTNSNLLCPIYQAWSGDLCQRLPLLAHMKHQERKSFTWTLFCTRFLKAALPILFHRWWVTRSLHRYQALWKSIMLVLYNWLVFHLLSFRYFCLAALSQQKRQRGLDLSQKLSMVGLPPCLLQSMMINFMIMVMMDVKIEEYN